jgi:hypothetical protein
VLLFRLLSVVFPPSFRRLSAVQNKRKNVQHATTRTRPPASFKKYQASNNTDAMEEELAATSERLKTITHSNNRIKAECASQLEQKQLELDELAEQIPTLFTDLQYVATFD